MTNHMSPGLLILQYCIGIIGNMVLAANTFFSIAKVLQYFLPRDAL